MTRALASAAVAAALALAPSAAPAKPKPAPPKKAAAGRIHVNPARVKAMHDRPTKLSLGLPQWTYGNGYSSIQTRWTPEFRVSPPVDGWVSDYDEAPGSAYRVRLGKVRFPNGKEPRSLYTDAQKAELFKNLVGHLYAIKPPVLDKVIAGDEGKALFAKFAEGIDGPGFDFPMSLATPR